ncbi:transmembrane protein, putative (macronuclear) [Tetrahymena thermophila SB210]|uniref:Transmembrane protein, putative n=1 Tax=Tetrahymena thermophila (strain SB210) TaxID=312017 RepID=Q22EZ4_TETTS|nr:transmembrane protein, putative [Tetrahymena thermophila SB210]EAR83881.2 transmembrane protein, putative [Tetrahymena thermophila SB210]|eukprot:XP_001031544.2 transmembrane protein, putative [Tetrahymena thermophila SB210]
MTINNNKQFYLLKRIILIIVVFSQLVHSLVEHCQYYLDQNQNQCKKCYGDLIPNLDRNHCVCPQFMYFIPSSLECTMVCPHTQFEDDSNMTCSEILQCPQQFLLGQSFYQSEISGLATYNDKYLASFDQKSVILWDMENKILLNSFKSNQVYGEENNLQQQSYQRKDNDPNSDDENSTQTQNEFFLGIKFLNESFLIGWTNYRILVWNVQQGYIENIVGYSLNQVNFFVKDASFGLNSIMFKDASSCQANYLISDIFDSDETKMSNDDGITSQSYIIDEIILNCNDTAAIQMLYSIGDKVYGLTYKQNLFEWSFSDNSGIIIEADRVDQFVMSAKKYNKSLWYLKNSTLNIISLNKIGQFQFEKQFSSFNLNKYENYTYFDFIYLENKNLVFFKLDTFIQIWFLNKTDNSFYCIQEISQCIDLQNCKYSNQLFYLKNELSEFLLAYSKIFNSVTIFSIISNDTGQIKLICKNPLVLDNKIFISSKYFYTYGTNIKQFTDGEQPNQQFQLQQLLGDVASSKIYSQNFEQIQNVATSSYNINLYYSLSQYNLIAWNLYHGKAVFNLQFSSVQQNMIAQGNLLVTASVASTIQEGAIDKYQIVYSIIMVRQDGFYKIGERYFEYNKDIKNLMLFKQQYLVASSNKQIKVFYIGDMDLGNQQSQNSSKDQSFEEENEFKIYFNNVNGNFIQIFLNQGLITIKNCLNITKILYNIQIDGLNLCEIIKYQENSSTLILVCTNLQKIYILDDTLQINYIISKKQNKKNSVLGLYFSKNLNQLTLLQRERFVIYDVVQKVEIFLQQINAQIVNLWQDFADTGKIFFLYDYKRYMIIDLYSSQKILIQDQYSSANILSKVFYDCLNDRLFYVFQNKTIHHQQFGNSTTILVTSNNSSITPFDAKNQKVFLEQIDNFIIVSNAQNNKLRIYDYLKNTQLVFSVDYQFTIFKIVPFKFMQQLLLFSSQRSEVILVDLKMVSEPNYQPNIYNLPENALSNVRIIVDQDNNNHIICYYDQLSQVFHIYSFPNIKKLYSVDMKQTFLFVTQFLDLQIDIINCQLQILAINYQGIYYVIFYEYQNQDFSFITIQDKANELIPIEYSHLYVVGIYQDKITFYDRKTGELYLQFQPSIPSALSATYSVDLLFHIFYSNSMGVVLDFENEGNKVFYYTDWPEQVKKFMCFRDLDFVLFIEVSSIAIANKKSGDLIYRYRMLDDQNQYLNYKYIEEKGLVIVQFMNNLVGYNILNLQLQFDIQIYPLSGSFLYKLDTHMILFCNKSDGTLQWIPYYSINQLQASQQPNNQQLILKITSTLYLMIDDDMVLWKYILGPFESYNFIAKFGNLVISMHLLDGLFPVIICQNAAYFFNYDLNGLTIYTPQSQFNYFLVQQNQIFEVGISSIFRIKLLQIKKTLDITVAKKDKGPSYQINSINIMDEQFDYKGIIKCIQIQNTDIGIFLNSSKKQNSFKSYVLEEYPKNNFNLVAVNSFSFASDIFFIKALSPDNIFVINSYSIYKFSIQGSTRSSQQVFKQIALAELQFMIDQTKFSDRYVFILSKIARKILVLDIKTLQKVYEIFTPGIQSQIQIVQQQYFVVFTAYQINFYELDTLQLNQIKTNFPFVKFIFYQQGDPFFVIATQSKIVFLSQEFVIAYSYQVENPRLVFYNISQKLGVTSIQMQFFSNLGLHILDVPLNYMSIQPFNNCYVDFNSDMKKYQQKQIINRIQPCIQAENQFDGITINYFLNQGEQPFMINELTEFKQKLRFRLFPYILVKDDSQEDSFSLDFLVFSKYLIKSLLVNGFFLQAPSLSRNNKYSQYSQIVILQKVNIFDISYQNNGFYLSDQSLLIINDLDLKNLRIVGNPLFRFKGQQQIIIKNLQMQNLTVEMNLFEFQGQSNLTIENVVIKNITLKEINLFQMTNVESLQIKNLFIQDCQSQNINNKVFESNVDEQMLANFIFSINGIYNLQIGNVTFQRMINTSFIFYNNVYSNEKSHQSLKYESIEMYDLQIQNNSCNQQLINIKSNNFILQDSYFFNNKCQTCVFGATLFLFQTNAEMFNVTMKNNTSVSGAAIFATTHSKLYIQHHSFFQFNEAYAFGGGIFLDQSDLFIDSTSYFIGNRANIGGAIFNQNNISCKQMIGVYKQQLINNSALIYGNNCGFMPSKIVLQDFQDQIKKDENNEFNYTLSNFMSGDIIEIRVVLYDDENSIVKISKYQHSHYLVQSFLQRIKILTISCTNNIKLAGQMILNYQNTDVDNNQWIFDDIRILGTPLDQGFIFLYLENLLENISIDAPLYNLSKKQLDKDIDVIPYNIDQTNQMQNIIQINVNFRQCNIGEILIQEKQYQICYPCPEGFYSLQAVSQIQNSTHLCLKCPEQARSCQGSLILLKNGYWRYDNYTDDILQCSYNPDNCQAESEESRFYCKQGFVGPLCESCDIYGKVWGESYMKYQRNCYKCRDMSTFQYYFPLIIIFFVMIIYIVFSIKLAIQMAQGFAYSYYLRMIGMISLGNSVIKDLSPFYIKQLIHFFQIANIISYEDYQLQKIYYYIPNTVSIPIGNFLYSFDCLFAKVDESKIQIAFLRIIWIFIIPLIYAISIVIIYSIMLLYKQQKFNKLFFSNGLFVLLIFLQPNIISSLLETVFCREIGNKLYIQADIMSECLSQMHLKSIAVISIPGLILWIFIIPIGILRKLWKNKQRLDSVSMRFNFGFLFQEYKQKFYYWEFIKSYKKIFIVLIHTSIQKRFFIKCSMIGVTLLAYLITSNQYRPYKMNRFNRIDRLLIIGLIFLIFINMCQYEAKYPVTQIICLIFNIIVYYAFLIYLFYISVREKLMSHFHTHILKIKSILKKKYPRVFSCFDTTEPINILRAHKNWKKVVNIVKNKRYLQLHIDRILFNSQSIQQPQAIYGHSQGQKKQENSNIQGYYDKSVCNNKFNSKEIINLDVQKEKIMFQGDSQPQSINFDYIQTIQKDNNTLNRLGSATSQIHSNNYLFQAENQEVFSNQFTIQVVNNNNDNNFEDKDVRNLKILNNIELQNNSFKQNEEQNPQLNPNKQVSSNNKTVMKDNENQVLNKVFEKQNKKFQSFLKKQKEEQLQNSNQQKVQSMPLICDFIDVINSQQKSNTDYDYIYQNKQEISNQQETFSDQKQMQSNKSQDIDNPYQFNQNKQNYTRVLNDGNQMFQNTSQNAEQKQVKRLYQNFDKKTEKKLYQPSILLNDTLGRDQKINNKFVKRLYNDSNNVQNYNKQTAVNQQQNKGMKSLNQKQIINLNQVNFDKQSLSSQFKMQRMNTKRRKNVIIQQNSDSSSDEEDSLNSSSEEEIQNNKFQNKQNVLGN